MYTSAGTTQSKERPRYSNQKCVKELSFKLVIKPELSLITIR